MNFAGIKKGLQIILNALEEEEVTEVKIVEEEEESSEPTKAEIEKMPAKALKAYAAELGVDCTGVRTKVLERVLQKRFGETEEEAVEAEKGDPEVSEKPKKKTLGKKLPKKEEKEESDEFDEKAEKVLEELDEEDVISTLKEIGVKATSKNVASKLAQALRDGLIDLDEDSDEEVPELTADAYFPRFDPKGYNNPENMTEERAEAVKKKVQEIIDGMDDLLVDDVEKYIEANATEDEIELLSEDAEPTEQMELYIELQKRFIDDDGEEHEIEDAYAVNEDSFCCAHPLKYLKKTNEYLCEKCGTRYEAE